MIFKVYTKRKRRNLTSEKKTKEKENRCVLFVDENVVFIIIINVMRERRRNDKKNVLSFLKSY